MECARIARAFAGVMNAAIAQLLQHYGVRLAALALCRRGDTVASLTALRAERDAAIARMRSVIRLERRAALAEARRRARLRRLFTSRAGASHPSPPHPKPSRPARTGPPQSSP